MIVKVLMENTAADPAFRAEHGLSLYIEANGKRILFDTGQSPAFTENAAKLGVDLSLADFAVLSHAHYDHGGGIPAFLSLNDHAPVYVSQYAFEEYLHGQDNYIGLDQALRGNPRLVSVGGDMKLGEGLGLFTGEGRAYRQPIEPYGLNARRSGAIVPDDFRHELYLLITEGGKRVLVSGCSHRGIVNIAAWFRPDVLIGGFHLMNLDPQDAGKATLDATATELLDGNTVYYTCHCTGVPQFRYLRERMLGRLFYIASGQEITL